MILRLASDVRTDKSVISEPSGYRNTPTVRSGCFILWPQLSTSYIAEVLARRLFHEGKPYDFIFDFTRSERLVCIEVVYHTYESNDNLSFQLAKQAGRMTLAADNLVQMASDCNGFEPVVFASTHHGDIAIGTNSDELLSQTRQTT